MTNRAELNQLIGKNVQITGPTGVTWTGVLVALADNPSMVIREESGKTVVLPQSFLFRTGPHGEEDHDG